MRRPALTPDRILALADHHRACTGGWPNVKSGRVRGDRSDSWGSIDGALRRGQRGMPGGSSLALFLAVHRGARNRTNVPRLSVGLILAWADAHRTRTGAWPTMDSGPVADAPDETWSGLDSALKLGSRGLAGGDSLGRLLARRRGARNHTNIPRLSVRKVLAWADAHHAWTGEWPNHLSGPIPEAAGDTWAAVESALQGGLRGLPGSTSLYRLLRKHRHIPGPRPAARRSRVKTGGRPRVRINFPEELLERVRAGELSTRDVAERCGVAHPVAIRELRRAGVDVPGRGRPAGKRPALHADVVRRYRAGQSMPHIAGELGLTRERVCTILRRYGVVRRPAGPDLFAHGLGPEDLRRLAARLGEARREAGLTQDEVAARTGLRQVTISALENGRQSPTRKTLTRLAKALRVRPEDLLPGTGDE